MENDQHSANAACIEREIAWFREVLDLRIRQRAEGKGGADPLTALAPPPLPSTGAYAGVVRRMALDVPERLILILAFLPHVQPDALDPFFVQNGAHDRSGASSRGFVPTGETALFLLAGDDVAARLRFRALLDPEHRLYLENVLRLERRQPGEPVLAAALTLTPEAVEQLASGRAYQPPYSPELGARRLTTRSEWSDLVLAASALAEIEDIVTWATQERTLLEEWQLAGRVKPGFRSLFHGHPGTGKTLTAALLGKRTGRPVYRIDASKDLASPFESFDEGRHPEWILYFDEADGLFAKRTESRNANDRAANQQLAYLLQRIEDFPGLVILATNLQEDVDEAFARRFQSVVHFPMPSAEERLRLWEASFRERPYRLAADVDLRKLAIDHELTGGSILNVLRYACLQAVRRDPPVIRDSDLEQAIHRELSKH